MPRHTDVPQEFLKLAIPGYLVGVLTSFPLDCQTKKMTIAIWCDWIKIMPVFWLDQEKI